MQSSLKKCILKSVSKCPRILSPTGGTVNLGKKENTTFGWRLDMGRGRDGKGNEWYQLTAPLAKPLHPLVIACLTPVGQPQFNKGKGEKVKSTPKKVKIGWALSISPYHSAIYTPPSLFFSSLECYLWQVFLVDFKAGIELEVGGLIR